MYAFPQDGFQNSTVGRSENDGGMVHENTETTGHFSVVGADSDQESMETFTDRPSNEYVLVRSLLFFF
jgi:hypothetical protein